MQTKEMSAVLLSAQKVKCVHAPNDECYFAVVVESWQGRQRRYTSLVWHRDSSDEEVGVGQLVHCGLSGV